MKMEIENLNLNFSDQTLKNKIINNKNFLDDKNNFSRTKYEKFLLENNLSAAQFENRLKSNELQKILFSYINGGLVVPKFLIDKKFANENKKIEIDFVNLQEKYKKDSSYSLYRLSRCYEKLDDYENSLKYLNIIIEQDPLYEKAWISIAKYYLRKNDHDKAIENLNKALNIISNNY